MASHYVYQFYSYLKGYEPKIWRRFRVPGNITMAQLGYALMTMYEMKGNHLFRLIVPVHKNTGQTQTLSGVDMLSLDEFWQFEIGNKELFLDERTKAFDASTYQLSSVLQGNKGEKLSMEYDYGDDWEVEIMLENVIDDVELPNRELSHVLTGEGFGIVEDCGGVAGLKKIAKAFQLRSGNEYEYYRKRLGEDEFDTTRFDLNDINLRLKHVPQIFEEIYERGNAPSQESLDFLEREYLK